MGNPVNSNTKVHTSVKVVDVDHEQFGQAGYVVVPPKPDEDEVQVKMDADGEVYKFALSEVEAIGE